MFRTTDLVECFVVLRYVTSRHGVTSPRILVFYRFLFIHKCTDDFVTVTVSMSTPTYSTIICIVNNLLEDMTNSRIFEMIIIIIVEIVT